MKSLLVLLLAGAAVAPCLWDSDTLDTELRGLPDAFDLVVGRWHRHGDAYYEARIARIVEDGLGGLGDYDDLAVAHERLGQRDEAIAVMERKQLALREAPNEEHQYRYHANLGTFYAHAGRFDEALAELRKALAINPDAHFGREKFQIELIEYVAAATDDPTLWSSSSFLRHAGYRLASWGAVRALGSDVHSTGQRELPSNEAYGAIAGMLRFGGLEGPELYRSLGELFLHEEALNLAWWSFGRAIERGHPASEGLAEAQLRIEAHWADTRAHTGRGPEAPTPADYAEIRGSADRWLRAFQAEEAAAVARGGDVTSDVALKQWMSAADAAEPRPALPGIPPAQWRYRDAVLLGAMGCALLLLFRLGSRTPRAAAA